MLSETSRQKFKNFGFILLMLRKGLSPQCLREQCPFSNAFSVSGHVDHRDRGAVLVRL